MIESLLDWDALELSLVWYVMVMIYWLFMYDQASYSFDVGQTKVIFGFVEGKSPEAEGAS